MTANDIRNIALLGHGGSGKTSLAEQMLYMTKEHAYRAIRELGKDALPALSTLEDLHGVGAQTKYQSHMPQPVIQALAEVLTRN